MTDFPKEITKLDIYSTYLTAGEIASKINELIDGFNAQREQLAFLRAKLEGQDEKFENHYHLVNTQNRTGVLTTSEPRDTLD